ncbi:MAG: zinc-dependent metalloprotease [Bacteroidales bacterium]|jgi:hypothetical protein|nr:zinc-dependent metalloprotease [Bacteroidales bacterium]
MQTIKQIIVLLWCTGFASTAMAQNMVYYEIEQAKADKISFTSVPDVFTKTTSDFKSENYFTHPEEVSFFNYTPVNLDNQEAISFAIPTGDGTLTVELIKTPANHFQYDVATSDGKTCPANPDIKHYRGIVRDNPNSWVAVTFFDKEIMGIIATEKGNFNLGKERASGRYIFYNENNLRERPGFSCATADDNSVQYDSAILFQAAPPSVEYIRQAVAQNTLKAVALYFETEYDILHSLGSIAAVEAYITGLFNQVATLYINERIITCMSRLNVWIEEDPYTAGNTSDLLIQFQNWRSDFPGAFIGNLGQLLTFRNINGGRAAGYSGLCNAKISQRLSVARINNESLMSDYSWSVYTVTHEFGHLLGSYHTHACVWNGNNTAIDGCEETEGNCARPPYPPNGGTIMSYCHLIGRPGIEFANGFGPQPGNVIRYSVANANCLPSVPQFNISGASSIFVCEPQTYYLTGTPVGGLQWRVSPHFLILSEESRKIVVQPLTASSGTAYIAVDLIVGGQVANTIQKNITISGTSLPSLISQENINITNAVTWSGEKLLATTAYVTSGGTLTITGNIVCTANAAIRVSAGGRLIIDGGTLTSACNGEMWKGIALIIPGNSQLSEAERYQGIVRMTNGATIANAQKGINIYSFPNTTFSGNLVNASNSYFVNNQIAVSNGPHSWFSDGLLPIPCRFYTCTFTVDNQYFTNSPFQCHVFLRSIKGVTFTACTFKNERAGDAGSGIGIEAVNSDFKVEGYCSNRFVRALDGSCPQADLIRSLFQGFSRGISVTGTATNNTVSIDEASFVNNLTGVYVNAVNNVSVLRSNFNLGKAISGIKTFVKKGVHLLNSTGFRVEENNFTGSLPNTSGLYGVVVENSGSNNNEIYKNRFEYLTVGQQFIGTNRNELIQGGVASGLKSLCNIHHNIAVKDIEVIPGLFNNEINSSSGIAYYQDGYNAAAQTLGKAAGNSFSATAPVNYDNNANPILYPYHAGTPNGYPTVSGHSITVVGAVAANSCLSKITGLFPYEYHEHIRDFYISVKSAWNSILYNYNQLMDGGSTQALLDAVQGEWKDDVWKLRQELMKKTPYLSRDVLMEVAKENSLPQALYLEVCLANPDATKDYSFLKFLQYEISNPLPAWMISLIESSWSEKTLRTDMESVLSATGSEKDFWLNLLISEAMHDSLQDRDGIRSLYMDRASCSDRLSVAEGYIEENSFDKAHEVIYDLTQAFPKYTEEQEKEISDFKDYIDWRNRLYNNNKSIYVLDSADLDWLISFVKNHTGRGRVLAHNILCELYGICLEEIPEKSLASNPSGGTGTSKGVDGSANFSAVKVSPNPAREYCSFSWDFGTGTQEQHFQLKITDASGRLMLTQPLEGAQGQWVWDTRTVARGSYAYSVVSGSVQLGNGKIIVTK